MFEYAETIRQAIKGWRAQAVNVGLGTTLREDVVEVAKLRAELEALELCVIADFDRARIADADGAASTEAWIKQKTHCGGEVHGRVHTARKLDSALPGFLDALAAGEITFTHALIASQAARGIDDEKVQAGERFLLGEAKRLDATKFRSIAHDWRYRTARQLADADAQWRDEARAFYASATFGGLVAVNGMLEPLGGETLLTAINALAKRQGPEDQRTPAQRRHDALIELARMALDSGELPDNGGERPHINVHVEAATLADPTQPGARMQGDWLDRIDLTHLGALCCDAAIVRIVMRGKCEVLDVGRATRIISPALRRALIARDKHCVFPGCDRPHRWCDAHHLKAWIEGGETSLANLALLCRYHHQRVHKGWTLWRHTDGTWYASNPDSPFDYRPPEERLVI